MLFHLSIDADEPRHVAEVLAEIMGGEALPFPSVIEGSWVALSGDARGTLIEVYPRGTELMIGAGDADGDIRKSHDSRVHHRRRERCAGDWVGTAARSAGNRRICRKQSAIRSGRSLGFRRIVN